ncbi:MAG TPA: hypothetical protein ENI32_07730 [Candidatus Syntrophoarchaeum butanivorans]|uniref:Uncharacterized protein n=1 Tax=Candidatus Syntropharchaeum butanivorans TaxID=1839936 RepID=A0A7J2S2P9_9EURY|nr:hypothetical protein [Candidatus Syntrophoarchaeum butanivorans]
MTEERAIVSVIVIVGILLLFAYTLFQLSKYADMMAGAFKSVALLGVVAVVAIAAGIALKRMVS